MTSIRHKKDAVLDAARDCVLAVGVRRTTLTDIARRAGVSRMTLYRRWPDVRTIVADLMTREWTALGTAMQPADDGRPVRPRLVEGLVTGGRTFRDHPLLRRPRRSTPRAASATSPPSPTRSWTSWWWASARPAPAPRWTPRPGACRSPRSTRTTWPSARPGGAPS